MFWKKKEAEDNYFSELSKNAYFPHDQKTVMEAIDSNGLWKESDEWRISTWTDFKITPITKDNEIWFKVSVKCDHEFTCHCPTIERAIEMAALYQQLIMKMLYQVGWPSWVSIEQSRL